MFETSQVRTQAIATRGRFSLFSVSVVIHTAVVVGAVAASIASVEFPKDAPDQIASVQFARAVPLPPPAQGPRVAQRRTTSTTPVQRTLSTAPVAPTTIPDVIPQVSPGDSPGAGEVTGPAGGDVAGDPSGVPGGIGTGTEAGPIEPEPQLYRPGGDVKAPRILHRVEPTYPQIAIQARKSGLVVVTCIIDKQGRVQSVEVLHSSFPPFEQAAVDAVRQWTFAPGSLNGRAVDTIFNLTVNFTLSGR